MKKIILILNIAVLIYCAWSIFVIYGFNMALEAREQCLRLENEKLFELTSGDERLAGWVENKIQTDREGTQILDSFSQWSQWTIAVLFACDLVLLFKNRAKH